MHRIAYLCIINSAEGTSWFNNLVILNFFLVTQPPTLSKMDNYSSLALPATATGWRPSVVDSSSGMFANCKPRVQLFADEDNGWPHIVLCGIVS